MGIYFIQSVATGMCITIGVAFALYLIFNEIKDWGEISNASQVEMYATVVSKRRRERRRRKLEKRQRNYYVEYQMDDGNKVECKVDKEVYNQLNKGDMGIISYSGMKYLGFRKAC